jgi:type VI secretion system protein ImpK
MNVAEEASMKPVDQRQGRLALAFQEMLTAVVRLRAGRQAVTDGELFRSQVRGALKSADQEARSLAYTEEDIRLGIFAVVAFLDETILNLQSPAFADWVRKPMQEELFGRHTAGEIFFDNIQRLMGRRETAELADVLEVYQICLLLGFAGKYSIVGRGELRAVTGAVEDKIKRIRAPRIEISPAWRLPGVQAVGRLGDAWTRRLQWAAGGVAVLALLLFVLYKALLSSGLGSLKSLVR